MCLSVRLSVVPLSFFSFPDDNLCKHQKFSQNLVCALILWRSGLELLMVKFSRSYMPETRPIFSFLDDNLSKHQWNFTKLCVCLDIVEIWFGIANGQISSNFDGVICPRHAHIFVFRMIT